MPVLLVGQGNINVSGSAGQVGAFQGAPDGAGGGGAGGTVLITARNTSTAVLDVVADGGAGGNTLNDFNNGVTPHGPGGGGGGGAILHNAPGLSLRTRSVTGGANGLTGGGNGIAHGAAAGSNGQVIPFSSASDPFATTNDSGCLPLLSVWKTTSTPTILQGGSATYKITVSNAPGRTTATNVNIRDVLPTGFTYQSTDAIVLGAGVTRTTVADPSSGAAIANWGTFSIPTGAKVEIEFTAKTSATIAAGTYQNPAQAIYPDPQRANETDTVTASYDAAAHPGEDVTVVAPTSSNNPNVLLVKRITAINQKSIDGLVNDETPPRASDDDNPNWPSQYLRGAIDGGAVKSGDEIEYTIYFLNAGRGDAKSFVICDRITPNQSFKPKVYGGTNKDKDLQIQIGTNTVQELAVGNNSSGSRIRFHDAGESVPSKCNLQGANNNGTVIVEVTGLSGVPNLSIVSGSVGAGTPISSYGLIRFTTRIR